jgi:hypothetical protein
MRGGGLLAVQISAKRTKGDKCTAREERGTHNFEFLRDLEEAVNIVPMRPSARKHKDRDGRQRTNLASYTGFPVHTT